jgi:hypothetical protein
MQDKNKPMLSGGCATDFFQGPRLPHERGVPARFGTPHLCGSEEFRRAPLSGQMSRRGTWALRSLDTGAIITVGQLTAPLCPAGASENSPAFQRRVGEPKEAPVPKGRLRPTSILSRPFGTRVSVLASPALKRRAIARCPSGTKLPRPRPGTFNRTPSTLAPRHPALAPRHSAPA